MTPVGPVRNLKITRSRVTTAIRSALTVTEQTTGRPDATDGLISVSRPVEDVRFILRTGLERRGREIWRIGGA
jgi:hypothetical protein